VKHSLRVLVISGAAAALITGLGAAASAATARTGPPAVLHVGQIARQNVAPRGGCEPDTLVEPHVAVSPFNSKIQVAVAHDCRFASGGAVDIAYAWTHDGGAHWHNAAMPGLTKAVGGKYDRASDPVAAFGADGSVYVSALVIDINNCNSGVAVSRSRDGGATFAKPVYAQQSTTCAISDDKNWLVTDTQPNSPFYGRLYQFWTEFLSSGASPQVVRWSDDNGRTWSSTHMLGPAKQFTQDSQPFVQPNGVITDVYFAAGQALGNGVIGNGAVGNGERQGFILRQGSGVSLVTRTSFSGGATWSKPALIQENIGGGPAGIRCCLPLMAGDRTTGHMYAVWNAPSPGDPVELSSSADGKHWSHPVQVTSGHPAAQYLNAAVAAAGGRVFVAYGTMSKPNVVQQELTWSANGGASFAAPIALGPPSNLRYAAVAGGKFPGDYTGLSATATRVTSAWCVSSRPPKATAAYHQTLYAAVLRP
jgi:hypothetical protein